MHVLTYEEITTPSDVPIRGLMTPGVARQLMATNTSNRTISLKSVEMYQREMEQGIFHFTGDPIRIDSDGNLMDGQHRLIAAINANTPFETVVVNNLPRSVMSVIDTGRKRSASDQLRVKGIPNATNVVSAINAVYALAANRVSFNATTVEIEEFIHKYPQIMDSVVKVQHTRAKERAAIPAVLAAIHFIATQALGKAQQADEFVHVFATGEKFHPEDAAFMCREYFIRTHTRFRTISLKLSTVRYMLVRSWNLFEQRQPGLKRPPSNFDETMIEGFDPASIGLAHIRHRSPTAIEEFRTPDQKRAPKPRKTERKRGKLMPLAQAPDIFAKPEDIPTVSELMPQAQPDATEEVVVPSTVTLRERVEKLVPVRRRTRPVSEPA